MSTSHESKASVKASSSKATRAAVGKSQTASARPAAHPTCSRGSAFLIIAARVLGIADEVKHCNIELVQLAASVKPIRDLVVRELKGADETRTLFLKERLRGVIRVLKEIEAHLKGMKQEIALSTLAETDDLKLLKTKLSSEIEAFRLSLEIKSLEPPKTALKDTAASVQTDTPCPTCCPISAPTMVTRDRKSNKKSTVDARPEATRDHSLDVSLPSLASPTCSGLSDGFSVLATIQLGGGPDNALSQGRPMHAVPRSKLDLNRGFASGIVRLALCGLC